MDRQDSHKISVVDSISTTGTTDSKIIPLEAVPSGFVTHGPWYNKFNGRWYYWYSEIIDEWVIFHVSCGSTMGHKNSICHICKLEVPKKLRTMIKLFNLC